MTRDEARDYIKRAVPCTDYLKRSKGARQYICPFCGSGTGANGTGALHYYPETNTVACFAMCKVNAGKGAQEGFSYDVIDLYKQERGVDYNTALKELSEQLGLEIEKYRPDGGKKAMTGSEKGAKRPQEATGATESAQEEAARINTPLTAKAPESALKREIDTAADYTEYYRACRAAINAPAAVEYLKGRGISIETAAACGVGFDPAADPAGAPGALGDAWRPHPCPRIIIPTSRAHYVGRRIDGAEEYPKLNPQGSTAGIFNLDAVKGAEFVFITEGAFDALSVVEAGAPAIALNGAGNVRILLEKLEQERPGAGTTFILGEDNDEAGDGASEALQAGLKKLNIPFIVADICGGCKDPNEALTKDPAAFKKAVSDAMRKEGARPDNTRDYLKAHFFEEVRKFDRPKKTGFNKLDTEAGGGLYSGLYILAAPPSLGKTTLALQMADQLAAGGEEVLFFSLEQSRLELVSKSLARYTVKKDQGGGLLFGEALDSVEARSCETYKDARKNKILMKATKDYAQAVEDRITVIEGNFECDLSYICERVESYIRRTGKRPVVFVDYLQIMRPERGVKFAGTKEVVEAAVTGLKRMSRALNVPVIAICSMNRSSYLYPVSFESLKETGGIEYSADVVWGLQLQYVSTLEYEQTGADVAKKGKTDTAKKDAEKRKQIDEEKSRNPRKMELVCLKNRFGKPVYKCKFDYFAKYELFTEE